MYVSWGIYIGKEGLGCRYSIDVMMKHLYRSTNRLGPC